MTAHSYFLTQDVVAHDAIEKLDASGICYIGHNVDGHDGVIINGGDVAAVCEMLGFDIANLDATATSVAGLYRPALVEKSTGETVIVIDSYVEPAPAPVEPDRHRILNRDLFNLSEVEKTLGREIVIHVGDGKARQPIHDGKMHVWVYASNAEGEYLFVESENFHSRLYMFDRYIRFGRRPLKPSGKGQVINTPEGTTLAEICEDNVFILHDLHINNIEGGYDEQVVLRKLCAMIPLYPQSAADYERVWKRTEEIYPTFVDGMSESNLDKMKRDLAKAREKIESWSRELAAQYANAKRLTRMVSLYSEDAAVRQKEARADFELLRNTRKVRLAMVTDGKIVVFTDTLYAVDERSGLKHELGEYRITINPREHLVKFHNLTRTVGHMNAPHVDSDGTACLGNFAEMLPELFGNCEFAMLTQMAIRFLESANVDDEWGRRVLWWPLANPDDTQRFLDFWAERGLITCDCSGCISYFRVRRCDQREEMNTPLAMITTYNIEKGKHESCNDSEETDEETDEETPQVTDPHIVEMIRAMATGPVATTPPISEDGPVEDGPDAESEPTETVDEGNV